jgi:predicted RNA-binding protein with PUA-like domain
MVDIVAIKATFNQVSLKDIKQKEDLKDIRLIKQGKLSVLSISDNEWEIILKMSETKISILFNYTFLLFLFMYKV